MDLDTENVKVLLHHSDNVSRHVDATAKMDMTRRNNIITAKKAKEAGYAPEGTVTMCLRLKDGYWTVTLSFDVVDALASRAHHVILGKPAMEDLCEKYTLSRHDVNVIDGMPPTQEQQEMDRVELERRRQQRQEQKDRDSAAGKQRRLEEIAKARAAAAAAEVEGVK